MPTRPVHAVVLPPGQRLYEALRAALSGEGPAILPLPPALPEPALAATLSALRPTHVVTGEGVRSYPGEGADDATAVVIATSGSTGAPKGVCLSAEALTASAAASLERLGARPGERWLCCVPVSHVSGLQVLVRGLVSGDEPVIHERYDPWAVTGSGARHVSMVPTQLRRLVDTGADLSGVSVLLGGAAATPSLIEAAVALGARVTRSYGMSETCGGCVYNGEPLRGVDLAIAPDGRVMISGDVVFSGYRLRPDLTAAAFSGGWFVTSDLGELSGGRLRVLGRADDVINTGGEKVVAAAVAEALSGHPGVRDVAVVGRPDAEWGERVTAVVVPADPAAPPALAELRDLVRRSLPAHAAPRELEVVEELPLLPNGKPDLAALRRAPAGRAP
ncbi:AMP-binding protein [Bailinhaonella thermotolerans]|uniref:AMP-dependent synthetase n=1 Tax=Bailinhaonella thermotolerans TaxID=1070861 RepID=A0A3A4AEW7_9ACTN|nr:AMP-binding protein [Bailinhaonella thermotolerans]RJL27195.1 AMP-dependent synthetase [Bailinhaonella thermotolerans]